MDPSVDPTKIPAAAPPPGLKPNFIDPASRGSQVVAAAVALPTIAFVLVCARVYTRIFVSRAFGLDDGRRSCRVFSRAPPPPPPRATTA